MPSSTRQLVVDVECYPNYFLVMVGTEDGRSRGFELYEDGEFDAQGLLSVLQHRSVEIVTFNGNTYDVPMIALACSGADCALLKRANDDLIENNLKPRFFYEKYSVPQPVFDHIDLIEVAPGMVSLKLYGARLHTKTLQDLPYAPHTLLSEKQKAKVFDYCRNDLRQTWELVSELRQQIDLRRAMSQMYATDLRSKSDAQIAENVLSTEFHRMTGRWPKRATTHKKSFYYEPPSNVRFITEDFKAALETIRTAEMVVKPTGHVEMPKAIANLKLKIGTGVYRIGIGGLHSSEKKVSYHSNKRDVVIDRDVASYYPTMMLNMEMYPDGMGEHFRDIYRRILEDRLEAKRGGNKVKAESLKITLNGTFGKTANKWSVLYQPEFMIRTTISGQLYLLMLIELLEVRGIPVVSANTDGVVVKCPRNMRKLFEKCVAVWEKATKLQTEETEYQAIYARDVNNYIAVKPDGSVKRKGVYGEAGLRKNPQNEICNDAVVEYLTHFVPVEQTIRACNDIRKFLSVRTVNGGAEKEGFKLGKVVRWYYSTEITGAIHYKTNGNAVPRSDNARPLNVLVDYIPADLDYDWYIQEAKGILVEIGAVLPANSEKLPRRNTKAWKALFEKGDIIESKTKRGKYEWKSAL
jgi:hypothetical protein